MNKTTRKKKTLLLFGMVAILALCKSSQKEECCLQYEINYLRDDELEPFATYSRGYVYICSLAKAKSVEEKASSNDIIVIDRRNEDNPEMIVLNSFEIDDKKQREEIIQILSKYEELYPSNWNRTQDSMANEWLIHNALYNMSLFHSRTTDVNLDNEDEEDYNSKILTKILGN